MRRDRSRLGARAPGRLSRRVARAHGRGPARGHARRVRVALGRRPRAEDRDAGVPARCARSRSRRSTATSSRPASTRQARGRRSTSTRRSRPASPRTGHTWASDERTLRRRRRRLGRGRRCRRGRARGARTPRAPARGRPAQDGADFTRWEAKAAHDLWWPIRFALIDGGAGGAVGLLAGPLRRRQHDDQHEGRAARAREGLREVARGERHRRRGRHGVRRVRSRTALRPRRAAARRPRAKRLAEERAHGRARLPRARLGARARALVHGHELHALRLVPAGLPDELGQVDAEHLHPGRLGDRPASSCAPTLASSAS